MAGPRAFTPRWAALMSAVLESLPASPVAAARAEMIAHDLAEER